MYVTFLAMIEESKGFILKMKSIKVNGKKVKIGKSTRKNKEYFAELPSGEKVHFADPDMTEYPGTDRGDNYCARSLGIAEEHDILDNIESPNFWSRQLWSCEEDESVDEDRFFGKIDVDELK